MNGLGYTLVARIEVSTALHASGRIIEVVTAAGCAILGLDIVEAGHDSVVLDVTCMSTSDDDGSSLRAALTSLDGCTVAHVSDATFLVHLGGKVEVTP